MSSLKKSGWTKEQHRQRHVELHQALDELVADWIGQNIKPSPNSKTLSNTSILDLMAWSFEQTKEPSTQPGFRDETKEN